MPLRDHFRPPVSKRTSWEAFHGMWPGAIVQQLRTTLPPGFTAGPRVHLGTFYDINKPAKDSVDCMSEPFLVVDNEAYHATTAPWTATEPSVAIDVEPDEEYE